MSTFNIDIPFNFWWTVNWTATDESIEENDIKGLLPQKPIDLPKPMFSPGLDPVELPALGSSFFIDREHAPERPLTISFGEKAVMIYEEDSVGSTHLRASCPYEKIQIITIDNREPNTNLLTTDDVSKLDLFIQLEQTRKALWETSDRAQSLQKENTSLMRHLSASEYRCSEVEAELIHIKKQLEERKELLNSFEID